MKTKKAPCPFSPHRGKIAKTPLHGEKREKLKAPTRRKSNKKASHIVGKTFYIFGGRACAFYCPPPPPPPPPLRASMPHSPSNKVEYGAPSSFTIN